MSSRIYAHFIGVGGAGMSGIARIAHDRGISVTGSDLKDSRYSKNLRDAGIPVAIGHAEENLGDPEVVVISSAIPESNPELAAARAREIPVWPRAQMLAHLAGELQTIAIAGTHGKTTTSAMVATMFEGMGLSPTYLVGGEVAARGTNAASGTGTHYIVEADESDGSFVYLDPHIAIVTNVEADHLDHYGSLERVEQTFVEFMGKVPPDGRLIVCADDARLCELARETSAPMLTYGAAELADVRYHDMVREGLRSRFTVTFPDGSRVDASITVPGEHMVQNATAALAAAWVAEGDLQAAASALGSYGGVRRRFDHVGTADSIDVVDDYAHHPTEVRATLQAASECGYERIWVIFQPHRYSRTETLGRDFGAAFDAADRVVLMDVYSAGETPIPGITGKTILDSLLEVDPRARVAYLPHRVDVVPFISRSVRPGDLILTMGAGDVTTLGPELVRDISETHEDTSTTSYAKERPCP